MPSCISKSRFIRVRISILASKIIFGHLEAAGGWSWRPARYRYKGHPLICRHVYLKVGLLGSEVQFLRKNDIWPPGGRWRLIRRPARYRYRGKHLICLHVYLKVGLLGLAFKFLYKKTSGHLEAAGGWSWRTARYRFKCHPLICLYIHQKVGLLGLGFQFLHQNEYQEADPGGQPGTNLQDVQV